MRTYLHFAVISMSVLLSTVLRADPGSIMGGGNFTDGRDSDDAKFKALQQLGAGMCRVNVYPRRYFSDKAPGPSSLDGAMQDAYEHGIKPMILFEFYGSYGDPGDYEKWRTIGRTWAEYWRPGGAWATRTGAKDWGVSVYSAFNEPDAKQVIDREKYRECLKGLADGVHSVDASLKVIPGGFCRANSHSDYTLRGYVPAIADLLNDGTLDGIDLHTYYDIEFAPMEKTHRNSAQSNFDDIKKASGITRDINFYCTEFNYKRREVSEDEAAAGLLTGIWDNLGVVGNAGQPVSGLAFVWNLFQGTDKTYYGLAAVSDPYVPGSRAQVVQMVIHLTRGMEFVSLDPRRSGVFVLERSDAKLWVWQNRAGWTEKPGDRFTIANLPAGTRCVEVYAWDGLQRAIDVKPAEPCTITELTPGQTYLFLARTDEGRAVQIRCEDDDARFAGSWESRSKVDERWQAPSGKTFRVSSGADAAASWILQINDAGTYELATRWVTLPGLAKATITITQGPMTREVELDQTRNGGQWFPVVSVPLRAEPVTVTLKPQGAAPIVADAVRVIRLK